MKIKDPKISCRLGQMEKCCIFVTCGADGFTCERGSGSSIEKVLTTRFNSGETKAKGFGGWESCENKKIIKEEVRFRQSELEQKVDYMRKELQMAEDELHDFEKENRKLLGV